MANDLSVALIKVLCIPREMHLQQWHRCSAVIPTVKQVGSFQLHALGAFQVVRCCNNRRLTVYNNNNINRQTICILPIWFTTTVDTINSSRFSSSSIRIIPALLLCPWTCTYLRDILSTRHRRPSIATPPGRPLVYLTNRIGFVFFYCICPSPLPIRIRLR